MMYPQAVSHGNVLTFTPPGFKQTLNVKFPDSRLAVCEKCKKNYKTRDMCRVRNSHTESPWSTAFICITLDDSCTDSDGRYIDKPMTVRMVQWQPFCVKKPFDSKTPVCAACKKTNRTRSFCRDRHQHRQLPWCTVYVLLSALESTDPTTVVAAPSKPLSEKPDDGSSAGEKKDDKKKQGGSEKLANEAAVAAAVNVAEMKDKSATETKVTHAESPDETSNKKDDAEENAVAKVKAEVQHESQPEEATKGTSKDGTKEAEAKLSTKAEPAKDSTAGGNAPDKTKKKKVSSGSVNDIIRDGENTGDDINNIAESRTFLAKVSCKANTVHWLELSDFDQGNGAIASESHMQAQMAGLGTQPMAVPGMHPAQTHYYVQAMGYASNQHQHALKTQQQYLLQMQQHQQQHFAAQQAAWQAQYNQQAQMQMAGQPGAPTTASQPTQTPPPGTPAPATPAPQTTPAVNAGQPATAPAPVTAGEAAAEQQKQNKNQTATGSTQAAATNATAAPQPSQPETTAGAAAAAAAAAAAQQQAHAQWQAHMMYQQQLYQQQLHMQQQGGQVMMPTQVALMAPPQQSMPGAPAPAVATQPQKEGDSASMPAPAAAAPVPVDDIEPAPVNAATETKNDPKRQRVV